MNKLKKVNYEEMEQILLMKWAKLEEGKHPELKLLFHVPNGGKRSATEASRLKAAGVKAGVPDLFLPVAKGKYHGLWIEMKYGTNKTTLTQKQWLADLDGQGYRTAVCYGFEEARDCILLYLMEGKWF